MFQSPTSTLGASFDFSFSNATFDEQELRREALQSLSKRSIEKSKFKEG